MSLQGWVVPQREPRTEWKKRRQMAQHHVPTKWCIFSGSEPKHASTIYTQKKVDIQHPAKYNYLPTKCGGVAKSWLVHTARPFCTFFFFLFAPIHFVSFCKTPRFTATNGTVVPRGVDVKRDIEINSYASKLWTLLRQLLRQKPTRKNM